MNRRSFLSLLGMAPLAIAIPERKKTYSFLGDIFRRRDYPFWVGDRGFDDLQEAVNFVEKGGSVRIMPGTWVIGKHIWVPHHYNGLCSPGALLQPEGDAVIQGCTFQGTGGRFTGEILG